MYETILGSAIAGALFGLLSGQPLLIIGCTGPLAVFEGSLYDVVCGFCISSETNKNNLKKSEFI